MQHPVAQTYTSVSISS